MIGHQLQRPRSRNEIAQSVEGSGHAMRTARFAEAFQHYVKEASFPCAGAKSAMNRNRMHFGLYEQLGRGARVEALCEDLGAMAEHYPDPGLDPVTFVAMFESPVHSESDFGKRLWEHLQAMHEHDRDAHSWDAAVSDDPTDRNFSFSIAGRAFFVVGLSPWASRLARRAPMPCLIFNFHDQFEALRGVGKYESMQKVIRTRDVRLQGSINPVLAAYGQDSEARQYTGEDVPENWGCPFAARATARKS